MYFSLAFIWPSRTISYVMSGTNKKRDFVGVSVRSAARKRIKAFADRRRMNFADAADVASVLLEQAPREQVDAVIERRPLEPAKS